MKVGSNLCHVSTHVSQGAHPALNQLPIHQSDSQAQVGDADVAFQE